MYLIILSYCQQFHCQLETKTRGFHCVRETSKSIMKARSECDKTHFFLCHVKKYCLHAMYSVCIVAMCIYKGSILIILQGRDIQERFPVDWE